MTVFLSLLNIIVFLCLDAFFVGLVIVLGFMQEWKGMLSYHDLQGLAPEKRSAWRFDPKRQIVLPYTKKTEPLLRQWISSDHWICSDGTPSDLDAQLPST